MYSLKTELGGGWGGGHRTSKIGESPCTNLIPTNNFTSHFYGRQEGKPRTFPPDFLLVETGMPRRKHQSKWPLGK